MNLSNATANQQDIARILRSQAGIITRRSSPDLVDSMRRMANRGQLRILLPGVYVVSSLTQDPWTRMRAAALWAPDAVLTGSAAAKLTFWPEISLGNVELAVSSPRRASRGFSTSRREIPWDLVMERQGIRCTAPALTALDLCDSYGGDAIDTALRSRQATLEGMHEAFRLTAGRVQNANRRMLLLDSRDEPWSAAERLAHRVFRADGLLGWKSNVPVPLIGVIYYVDVAFEEAMLAVEIDGREYHGEPSSELDRKRRLAFESDRWRQNDLVLNGWRVLRFTWDMLTRFPHLVLAAIRRALAA